jgi:hypothetical protein
MIEQGLVQLLNTNAGVTALVPDDSAGTPQIYWGAAPKSAKVPYIVLSRVGTKDEYTMAGPIGQRNGLFQVSCFTDSTTGVANGYYTSRAMSVAVRQVLQSYRGNLPDTQSTAVTAVFTEKDWDMPYEEGSKGFVFHALLQFRVWYLETSFTVPTSPSEELIIDGGN